ncbi:predicted protein [Plenodomus lingam JN3]|uniref:Uncharacterized protein n=1 Tax=Leptosphaeria maculans (strain JN3 / isolate v23.1.3 / race Av1-4-5-6-7-8) TaxID=985895 RepID=E5A6B6_LEPMJ|nr:predicted protein [Plenodomus lingam JN3]CBX99161.1 predicted protein [Plenodomus lingam JN3]
MYMNSNIQSTTATFSMSGPVLLEIMYNFISYRIARRNYECAVSRLPSSVSLSSITSPNPTSPTPSPPPLFNPQFSRLNPNAIH